MQPNGEASISFLVRILSAVNKLDKFILRDWLRIKIDLLHV